MSQPSLAYSVAPFEDTNTEARHTELPHLQAAAQHTYCEHHHATFATANNQRPVHTIKQRVMLTARRSVNAQFPKQRTEFRAKIEKQTVHGYDHA
eukprot:IDg2222t1